MSTSEQYLPEEEPKDTTVSNARSSPSRVFADPVAYLATLGVESELIEVRALPAAA
jgi:hypothetical protein